MADQQGQPGNDVLDQDSDGTLIAIDRDGVRHELAAVEGWRVMEVLRDWGLPIKAECGGACQCATCHVLIAPEWLQRLEPPRDDEIDMLDTLPLIETNSRLSCQILWSRALDGLELTLAPDVD